LVSGNGGSGASGSKREASHPSATDSEAIALSGYKPARRACAGYLVMTHN
jgi:hypothetical protein